MLSRSRGGRRCRRRLLLLLLWLWCRLLWSGFRLRFSRGRLRRETKLLALPGRNESSGSSWLSFLLRCRSGFGLWLRLCFGFWLWLRFGLRGRCRCRLG